MSPSPPLDAHTVLLREAGLLSPTPDATFDRFTRLARKLLGVPVAQLNVIAEGRQVPLSVAGPEPWNQAQERPAEEGFCHRVLTTTGVPLAAADARRELELRHHPAVQDDGVVAYAARPVVVDDEHVVGTLCVVDLEARTWSEEELDDLRDLAAGAATEIELRLDMARRRRVESRLREANDLLEARVRERTAEVEAARERVHAILESITDRFYALDRTWCFTYVNRKGAALMGVPAEELVGQRLWDLAPDSEGGRFHRTMERVLETGRPEILEMQSLFGDHNWLEVHVYPAPEGVSIFSQDITERREREATQEALRRTEEQLRHSQKLEALGRLAGGVAHDFNNVLTAIQGYCHLLLMDLEEEDGSWTSVSEIARSSKRASGIVKQLLAFSRQQVVSLEAVSLNEVVEDVEGMLRQLIGEDVRLVTRLDAELDPVLADRGHLEQVLVNLAVNARDAMPQGGTLTFVTENVRLGDEDPARPPTLDPGPYTRISVQDNGTGIPRGVLERIFDPFFTTKEPGRGTGLGLSTAHGIVRQLGGDIGVHSETGRGTIFRILLPRAAAFEPEEAGDAMSGSGSDLPGGSEVVLLVDDDRGVLEVTRQMLRRLGYRVQIAADAATALRMAREHPGPIDLLLTDVVMPGTSGTRLASQVREVRPGIRVLYASGWTEKEVARRARLDAGADLLFKPFEFPRLARRVRRALDRELRDDNGERGMGA